MGWIFSYEILSVVSSSTVENESKDTSFTRNSDWKINLLSDMDHTTIQIGILLGKST